MIIAVDFDGVISYYDKWKGSGVFGEPIEGAKEALDAFKKEGHIILINTTRLEINKVSEFLNYHKIPFDYINHSPDNVKFMYHPAKQQADVYIDDRGVCFQGKWNKEFVEKILHFKTWWMKEEISAKEKR